MNKTLLYLNLDLSAAYTAQLQKVKRELKESHPALKHTDYFRTKQKQENSLHEMIATLKLDFDRFVIQGRGNKA